VTGPELIWGPGRHQVDLTFARASSLRASPAWTGKWITLKEVILMARVIVLPNAEHLTEDLSGPVLLDERVDPVNLEDEHSSLQFIERVAWAVRDAEGMVVAKR